MRDKNTAAALSFVSKKHKKKKQLKKNAGDKPGEENANQKVDIHIASGQILFNLKKKKPWQYSVVPQY
jgi:hypothetical protein